MSFIRRVDARPRVDRSLVDRYARALLCVLFAGLIVAALHPRPQAAAAAGASDARAWVVSDGLTVRYTCGGETGTRDVLGAGAIGTVHYPAASAVFPVAYRVPDLPAGAVVTGVEARYRWRRAGGEDAPVPTVLIVDQYGAGNGTAAWNAAGRAAMQSAGAPLKVQVFIQASGAA